MWVGGVGAFVRPADGSAGALNRQRGFLPGLLMPHAVYLPDQFFDRGLGTFGKTRNSVQCLFFSWLKRFISERAGRDTKLVAHGTIETWRR